MTVHGRLALLIGVLAVLLSACQISIVMPPLPGVPAGVPGIVDTIVVGTAGAAQTQTAELIPPTKTSTWTPLPTHTPSLTPTLTPTFHFGLGAPSTPTSPPSSVFPAAATQTASASDKLDGCILLSQTPADGSHYASNASFTVAWKVKNTGSSIWYVDTVDFAYVSGTRMEKKPVYDLPVDIPRGEYVTLKVPMTAPKKAGTYLTVWSLRRGQVAYPNPGDKTFCHVDITIRVP